jgi:hypothetical protein
MRREVAELFHIERAAVNLAKPTLGMAIVLVALILLSTIGPFGFTMAFGAVLAVAFDGGGSRRRRVAGLVVFAPVRHAGHARGSQRQHAGHRPVVVLAGRRG